MMNNNSKVRNAAYININLNTVLFMITSTDRRPGRDIIRD